MPKYRQENPVSGYLDKRHERNTFKGEKCSGRLNAKIRHSRIVCFYSGIKIAKGA